MTRIAVFGALLLSGCGGSSLSDNQRAEVEAAAEVALRAYADSHSFLRNFEHSR